MVTLEKTKSTTEVRSTKKRAEKLSKRIRESLKNLKKQKEFRDNGEFPDGASIAQDEFQIESYGMTPKLAQEILDNCNILNRKRDERKVSQYTQEIKNGDWKFEASSVMIDNKGVLIDGQHTLAAIAAAKQKTPVILMTGCRQGVAEKIDCGRGRTVAQRFKFSGVFPTDNPNVKNQFMLRVVGTILRTQESFHGNPIKKGEICDRGLNYYPDATIKKYLKEFSDAFEYFYENKARSRGFSSPSVLAPILMYFNRNEEKAKKFYNTLLAGEYTGTITAATNAVRALRKQILKIYHALDNDQHHKLPNKFYGSGRSSELYFFNMVNKCVDCYDKNKTFTIE